MKVASGRTSSVGMAAGCTGARVTDHAPDGRWHTTTFLAALRVTGLTAPAVFDGPINGASFLAYIEQVLPPLVGPGELLTWLPPEFVAGLPQKERDALSA